MSFFHVICRQVIGRPLHSALTAATLAVTVALTTLLYGAVWGFSAAALDSLESRGVDIVVFRAGVADRANSSLQVGLIRRLQTLPEVAEAAGSLTETVSLGRGVLGIPLIGRDPNAFAWRNLQLTSGEKPAADDSQGVLLGPGLAATLGASPGEPLTIEDTRFVVRGVFRSENAVEANMILAPLPVVQKLMGREEQVSQVEVRLRSEYAAQNAASTVCGRIETLRNEQDQPLGLQALPAREFVDTSMQSKLAAAAALGATIIAVALSGLSVLNIMLVSVFERRREVGVLRALGWPPARVVTLFLGETMLITLVASVAGAAMSLVAAPLLYRIPVIAEFATPFPPLAAVLLGSLPGMAAAFVGALYPAWRVSHIPAVEALHDE